MAEKDDFYTFGPFTLDIRNRRILKNGEPVKWWSRKNYELLRVLMEANGEVVTYDQLTAEVWPHRPNILIHTINRTANNLKNRLGMYGDCVQNQPGVGFYFRRPARTVVLEPISDLDLETLGLYGRALEDWNRRTQASLQRAMQDFRYVVERFPKFVPALLGLADCLTLLGHAGFPVFRPAEVLPEARSVAQRALEFAGDSETAAQALTALGKVTLFESDFTKAEERFCEARAANPRHAAAHHGLGHIFLITNRHEEALAALAQARRLAPSSPMIHGTYGWLLYFMGRYKEAIDNCRRTTSLYPQFPAGYVMLGHALEAQELYPAAIEAFQTSYDLEPSPVPLAGLGHVHGVLHRLRSVSHMRNELRAMATAQSCIVGPYHFALIHAGLGEVSEAVGCLEKAYKERFDWLIYLPVDPRWQPLYGSKRFRTLLRRLGLYEFWKVRQP